MDKFIITADKAGIRLDKYLSDKTGLSRSRVKRDIVNGFVTVNNLPAMPDYKLKGGELIEYEPSPPENIEIKPEAIPIRVLYQDEDIIVINKPAGLVVHPGAGNRSGTLVNALLYWYNDWEINGYVRPGIVHRLDKDTSGVLVVARNEGAQKNLIDQFKNRKIIKRYLAIVIGELPDKGILNLPIGRDRYNRLKFSASSSSPKEAVTEWNVIERFGEIAYVEVRPKTGRTHQIRVHLSHLGCPLVGDDLYGGVKKSKRIKNEKLRSILLEFPRHALHANYISFIHPTTGNIVKFSAPLPGDMKNLIENLREWYDSFKSEIA